MSDQKTEHEEEIISAKAAPIMIHAQYVKDLSFENPNAPHTLRSGSGGPEMDININLGAKEIEDENMSGLYEVTLMLSATAKKGDQVYFIAEIQYAALVGMKDVPEAQRHPMLFIEVPRQMFPFARQILAEVTGNGGYPPLLLNPVDFQGMYIERFAKDLEESKARSNGKAA